MFDLRTDLALEAHELAQKNKEHVVDGVIFKEENAKGYKVTRIEILNSEGELATGKPMGKYLTLDVGRLWDKGTAELKDSTALLSELISELVPPSDSVLTVGLGNTTITADALGPEVLSHLIVTRHLITNAPDIYRDMEFFDLSALSPGVLAQTGIEASEIIKSVAHRLSPSLLIVIDALASREVSRLGSVIQISDTGIVPGSGVGNSRPELTAESMGIPVISIGVPTVVDALTLTMNVMELCGNDAGCLDTTRLAECKNMFVTPKDCDKIISFMSRVIGYAINMAFHKKLSFEDIVSILS